MIRDLNLLSIIWFPYSGEADRRTAQRLSNALLWTGTATKHINNYSILINRMYFWWETEAFIWIYALFKAAKTIILPDRTQQLPRSVIFFVSPCDFGVSAPIEAAADRQLSCSDRSNCCFCAGSVVALERVTHGWQRCLTGTQSGERTLNIAYTQTDINVFFRFKAKIHLVAAHMQQHSALFSFYVLYCFSNFKGCRLWSTTLTMDK